MAQVARNSAGLAACLALMGTVAADPVQPLAQLSLLNPFSVALLCTALLLAGSVVKAMRIVPVSAHIRVDRLFTALTGAVLLVFLSQRLSAAAEAGDISMKRFIQYFFAGGICAFVTHAACTPIDVVKTRIQTTQGRYTGIAHAFRTIVAEEGAQTLLKGLGATAGGYFLHGAFKYSFYEVFKILLSRNVHDAQEPPLAIAALSGLFAECIACLLLCPMEAIRIRSVADSSFPSDVSSGLSLLFKMEGIHGWYKGLPAMLLKQVPYTVGQFVSFEVAVKFVKSSVEILLSVGSKTGVRTGSSTAAAVSTVAGLMAGITAAVISHPGDTILSRINQEESDGSAWTQILRVARTAGFWGLFIGLTARIVQVSCMVGGQFLIYDTIKLLCGIPTASTSSSAVIAGGAVSLSAVANNVHAKQVARSLSMKAAGTARSVANTQ